MNRKQLDAVLAAQLSSILTKYPKSMFRFGIERGQYDAPSNDGYVRVEPSGDFTITIGVSGEEENEG